MNHKWIRDINLHKIKVNKKGSHNKILKTKNTVFNSYIDYLNLTKIANINPINRQTTKSVYNNKNNSEEKMRKNNLHIKCIEENILLKKEGNILDDLINNRYLKPILESQDIDEKLLNCNLKEPVKNNFNVSLNDFFNRRKKYYINFKTPKPELNKIRGISIKTNNYNNYNEELSGISIYNKTMGNTESNIKQNSRCNNINNYYNNIKMTNNYYNNYNNNEINILNPPFYNKGIKINNICSSSVRKKMRKYISNYNSNERNNINKIKSPDLHVFKSQTYSQQEKNYSENYLKYNNKIRNNINKEINIKNMTNINIDNNEEINEEDNINKKYNDIKNIIKHNNKYDYSKKLFDIYRGKLIKEFIRHIQKGINKTLLNIFHFFIEQIQLNDKKYLKKIDEIFIPKIHLEKPNKDLIKEKNNIKNPYLQIFNSEKKEYKRYMNNTNKITEYKRYKNNININNSAIISNQIDNNNIIKTNRNSMIIEENKNNIQIIKLNTNNINNNSGLIYKKKKLNNKFQKKKENILSNSRGKIIDIDINLGKPLREISDINPMESGIFINKYNLNKKKYKSSLSTNKREKRKIKSKSKRKKLSLPKKKYLEEISDSSSDKDNFYLDKNNSNFNIDNIDNSFDKHIINNNFSIKTNNNIIQPLIYKTTKINNNNNKNKTYQINTNKYKKIPEKNIVTADKRLFININYISCLSYENNISSKIKYKNSSLIIKRNIYFPIFSQKIIRNKTTSSNFINISNNNRNSNNILEGKNKKMNMTNYITNDKNKYLNSCVKFIIKNINKVFMGKSFKFFLNECKKKNKNRSQNKEGYKYRMKTYKKKIGNNKI